MSRFLFNGRTVIVVERVLDTVTTCCQVTLLQMKKKKKVIFRLS